MILCENRLSWSFLQGPGFILHPNTHMHRQTQRTDSVKQIIVFPHWKKSIHIPLGDGTAESLYFQSWIFFRASTNNGHLTSKSFWTSLFSLSPILPLFLGFWSNILLSNAGPEIIYWQLLHSIQHCQQQAGVGTRRWAVCYSCHKVLNLEGLLHGDRSVSEAGRWAAAAASCLCDLTVCVNQERVSARPASLISISLQITPRRQREGGEL